MNVNKIDDFKVLKGGIDINTLEELIFQLLCLLSVNKTSWLEGIELLNDLIHKKKQDGSVLSDKSSELILNWIDSVYENKIFDSFSGGWLELCEDPESKKIIFTTELTTDTIFCIHHNVDVLPFLKFRLEKSSNEYESSEIENLINRVQVSMANLKQKVSDDILNQVLLRANEYLESHYKAEKNGYLLCGLRESITEHAFCYSISCCVKSEQYLSPVKKTKFIGSHGILLSKEGNIIEFTGSSPSVDWVKKFELKLRNQEQYWLVKIPFENKRINEFVEIFNLSPSEIKDMLVENKIILEERINTDDFLGVTYRELGFFDEGSDEEYIYNPSFINIVKKFNELGIECKIEIVEKKATNMI